MSLRPPRPLDFAAHVIGWAVCIGLSGHLFMAFLGVGPTERCTLNVAYESKETFYLIRQYWACPSEGGSPQTGLKIIVKTEAEAKAIVAEINAVGEYWRWSPPYIITTIAWWICTIPWPIVWSGTHTNMW